MSAIHVLEYIIGLAIFGFAYWLLDGIVQILKGYSLTTPPYDLILYIWTGTIVVYLIFGIIWLARTYSEPEGGMMK